MTDESTEKVQQLVTKQNVVAAIRALALLFAALGPMPLILFGGAGYIHAEWGAPRYVAAPLGILAAAVWASGWMFIVARLEGRKHG